MNEQRFTIILVGKDVLTEEVVERLYERCDDATAGSCNGVSHVHFDREARSLNEAIASAVADLKMCGLDVERIEIDPADVLDDAHATA